MNLVLDLGKVQYTYDTTYATYFDESVMERTNREDIRVMRSDILEIRTEIKHPDLEKIIESITVAISERKHLEESRPTMDAPRSKAVKIPEQDEFGVFDQEMEFATEEHTWAGILKLIT